MPSRLNLTFVANCGRREIKLLWCGGWAVLIVAMMCTAAAIGGRNDGTDCSASHSDISGEWYNLTVEDGRYRIGAYETCLEEPGNTTCAPVRFSTWAGLTAPRTMFGGTHCAQRFPRRERRQLVLRQRCWRCVDDLHIGSSLTCVQLLAGLQVIAFLLMCQCAKKSCGPRSLFKSESTHRIFCRRWAWIVILGTVVTSVLCLASWASFVNATVTCNDLPPGNLSPDLFRMYPHL